MTYRERFIVKPRSHFKLKDVDFKDTLGIATKKDAHVLLKDSIDRLETNQDLLYAQDNYALLVVLQAMDAAGKDSTVKHVLTGVNPRGVKVVSFGAPSKEELDHDYLWRTVGHLPERGVIGIHNRSHYEEVIVTRVHPEILAAQKLPDVDRGQKIIKRRFKEINRFERYLVDNGTIVIKFFLYVSREEQWKRFKERMEEPEKYWKFQAHDLGERARWSDYMAAYEDVFHHTSTGYAPWFVIPSDFKWFAWVAVAEIINETLAALNLKYPEVPESVKADWAKARAELDKLV